MGCGSLAVCREFAEYREASLGRITTEEGKLLRVNRSIQAEGAFGQLKHNRKFVRFLTAGNVKVACELFLLAISQNIRKAIVKCDTGRLENHILHPASLLNFLRIRKSKVENQSHPEASDVWLWFVFAYFSRFMALSVQAEMRTGLLQILALLQ